MAMQNYTPMRLPPTIDPLLRNDLLRVDRFLRQLTPWTARVPAAPQGTRGNEIDLTKFLYLPGRSPLQRAFGNNTFSMKSANQATVTTDAEVMGFALEGLNDGGTNNFKETVYFSGDYTAGKTLQRRWIFPSISASTTDEYTFVATSGSQTVAGKILTTGQIYVGTAATRNTFVNSNNVNQNFFIGVNTGFPTVGTQTPTMRLPPLDVSVPVVDDHTFMVLAKATSAPFNVGSIPHGNHQGTEMEMLALGVQDSLLQCNEGQTLANCTWTAGGTVITVPAGLDSTKTRPGMRVRGNNGTSAYIERGTLITIVGALTITVDTPLVGNNAGGATVISYGPTWTSTIPAGFVDHGGLLGLTDDDHTQYLRLVGRTNGQIISQTVQTHTGMGDDSLAIQGALILDPDDQSFSVSGGVSALDARIKPTGGAKINAQLFYDLSSQTGSGNSIALNAQVSGTYAGTTTVARGITFISTAGVAAGSTLSESTAAFFTVSPTAAAGSTLGRVAGIRMTVSAPTTNTVIASGVIGVECLVGPRGLSGNLINFYADAVSGSAATNAVSNYWGLLIGSTAGGTPFDSASVVNWNGIQIPNAPANPTGTIRGLNIGDIWSHHVGPFRFGSTATPTHFVDIAAGTTGIAPIKLTTGTNLTAAIAGCVEYDGTDLMFTHGDAVRTKVVTQRGALNLTGQAAAIGATTLYAAPAAGYYVFNYTLEVTTLDATAGTIQVQVNYTDDVGATNQTGAALVLTATGRDRGSFQVYANAGQNIQYQTNVTGAVNAARYALRARLTYLG